MVYSMTNDLQIKRDRYKGVVNYEAILGAHINRIAIYRDTDPKKYASSVETYILMCPDNIRQDCIKQISRLGLKKARYDTMNADKMVLYDNLWSYVNEKLERKANLIFKTAEYEIGKEH